MPSSIPFVNIYLFNIAQSVIAIFLAGSFLKRDKKLDTAEVIYVRPMSNADYIIGKTWGLSLIHISEPTRRVVISYAVFCLKKIFFNDTATTEIYTRLFVGSVRCV